MNEPMRIAVIAMGKVGLTLAVQAAEKGHFVTAVDREIDVMKALNSGVLPFAGEARLQGKLTRSVEAGLFTTVHSPTAAVLNSQWVVIAVPTRGGDSAALSALADLVDEVAAALQPGATIIFETEQPGGTTRERWVPLLESASSLTAGQDFFVAFSPTSRSDTGRFSGLHEAPKFVAGIDRHSSLKAFDFYNSFLSFGSKSSGDRFGVQILDSIEKAERLTQSARHAIDGVH